MQGMARRFAEAEIKSKAAELDERRRFPADITRWLGEQKMLGIAVTEEYGGGIQILSGYEYCTYHPMRQHL